MPTRARLTPAEAARWQRLEEREFGRLAQEADHLFDTSLTF
jgi:CelD/BcsL family acetyltransferase involved in cellulose biosynthesis